MSSGTGGLLTTHVLSYSADHTMRIWDLMAIEGDEVAGCVCLEGHDDWVVGARVVSIAVVRGEDMMRRGTFHQNTYTYCCLFCCVCLFCCRVKTTE